MTRNLPRLSAVLCVAVTVAAWTTAVRTLQQPEAGDAVILITFDGARVEEMFGGLDRDIHASTLRAGQTLEEQAAYKRFHAETPAARREKLMPFFWSVLMTAHGSIAGNPRLNSSVTLTNRHRFSYPGYSEILVGEAHDDTIKSNDAIQNPHVTVLEEIQTRKRLPRSGAAVFASWNVFNAIVEHTAGAMTVNAGVEAFEHADPATRALSAHQFLTPTPWDGVRHDAYTFRFAMAHLRTARPRVMYIAFDETDDLSHDGKYDRLLDSYRRLDDFLKELWTWLQADSGYRNRTHILITTDHGRGRTAKDWRDHGAKVEGAQDVWMAFISPRMSRRGEWRDHAPLYTNQAAATMAAWMGIDWKALRPGAGPPIAD